MKNYFKIALVAIGLLSLFSCDDDDKKNRLPSAAALTSPENAATDLATLPTLTWVKSIDPDNDVVSYDVYVSESEEFVSEDKMGVKIAENTYTLKTALKPHTKYFWKVVALDEDEASAESEVRYFTTMNSAPAISGLEFPANEATEVEKSINLKWTAADADGDVLKYTVYLAKENTFTDDNIIATDISESEFAVNLDGHTQYFWKLIATDTEGAKIESDVASFTTMNTLPSKVDLTAPANEFDKVSGSVKIAWSAATDADNDAVTYNVFYGTNKEINEKFAYKKGFTETELTLSNLRGNTTYYWKVIAVDSEEGMTSSDVFSFSTINTVPTASVLNSEIEQLIVNEKLNVVISWKASIDPDKTRNSENKLVPEPLVYDIYLSTDATFEESELIQKDVSDLSFTLENVEFATKYFAKIETRDTKNAKAESNIIEFTTKIKTVALVDGTEGTFIDPRDNHEYKTIVINGKEWLAENFAYLPFFVDPSSEDNKCSVNGLALKPSWGQKDFVMPTIEDAKAHENYIKYGAMYSKGMLATLAPEGWHVATDEEWKGIEKFSGMTDSEIAGGFGYRGETANKFITTTGEWSASKLTITPTDEFGFTVTPGGYFSLSDKGVGAYTYFWTSTYSGFNNWYRCFSGVKTGVYRRDNKNASVRMYVRLVKD
ncbi:hypothetical protein L3073_09115 [Ancylomarina sp. DW003]|nr:FISUMP domain-containing protein [Ancylomarina sp. DW003]MDE5422363.1 hypothetical protein [Ancylomarina sp. DW003]